MQQLLITCRAGLEADIAAEIQAKSAAVGVHGFVRAQAGDGYVIFEGYQPDSAESLVQRLPFADLVFARQWMVVLAHIELDTPTDRIAPMVAALQDAPAYHGCWLTFPDTNDGKSLSRLTRKLEKPLEKALSSQQARTPEQAPWIVQVFFLSGEDFRVGLTPRRNASPWEMGYPRLRQPPCR